MHYRVPPDQERWEPVEGSRAIGEHIKTEVWPRHLSGSRQPAATTAALLVE